MTAANPFRMPFLMDADRAARIIRRGLERNRSRIAFPFPTHVSAWLAGALPAAVADRLIGGLPRKPPLTPTDRNLGASSELSQGRGARPLPPRPSARCPDSTPKATQT